MVFLGPMVVIWGVVVDTGCVGGEEVVSVGDVEVVDSVDGEGEEGVVQTDSGKTWHICIDECCVCVCVGGGGGLCSLFTWVCTKASCMHKEK